MSKTLFVIPPFFHDAINGFVSGYNENIGRHKAFTFYVFKNLQDAAKFAYDFYEQHKSSDPPIVGGPPHWDIRTFGPTVNRSLIETEKPFGSFITIFEEFQKRKLFKVIFNSNVDYLLIDWNVFDSMITPERIKEVVAVITGQSSTGHFEFEIPNPVDENKY